MHVIIKPWLLGTLWLSLALTGRSAPLTVSADFPGGSARVEGIDQKTRTIRLSPIPHLERGWVCWWYCKIEGIKPGETLVLDVGGGVWATPDRASFSLDNKTWQHTSAGQRSKKRIVYRQRVDAKSAWFAWGPSYVLANSTQAVAMAARRSPHATSFVLCRSKDGKEVPGLHVEQPGVKDAERLGIWIQARQHAWEAGSSWVCQGFMNWLLSDDKSAEELRKKASIYIIPIMDVDNVERGAGGKNQKPHDHNRDWSDRPVWPEVAAAQKRIQDLNRAGKFDLFVDLHNPGAGDRQPFFFVPPPELLTIQRRNNLAIFLAAARKEITGPLKLAARTRPSGAKYDRNWKKISKNWVTLNTRDNVVAVTLETSWNTPHSTQENYQKVGEQLGRSLERCFR